ncbi:MAG: DUF2927 domain-containing protein [Cyanobacteria bacterium J06633_2]
MSLIHKIFSKLKQHRGDIVVGLAVPSMVIAASSQLFAGSSLQKPYVVGMSSHAAAHHSEHPQRSPELASEKSAPDRVHCAARLTAQHPSSVINVRSRPSIAGEQLQRGRVGDRVAIVGQTVADDNYAWYNVRFQTPPNAEGWIRGDFIALNQADCTIDASAGRRSVNTTTGNLEPTEQNPVEPETTNSHPSETPLLEETPVNLIFSPSEIAYFLDVAFGSEHGDNTARVRRWEQDVCIHLNFPDEENIAPASEAAVRTDVSHVVDDIQDTLNHLMTVVAASMTHGRDNPVHFNLSHGDSWMPINIGILGIDSHCKEANIEFFYVQSENFRQYDPNPRPGQVGHVWAWWRNEEIYQARILVSSNGLTDDERVHVIREEMTQALGILKDSWNYPSSIFYQGWTSTTDYDPIDEAVISMLYHPSIQPGMSRDEAEAILNQLEISH